MKIRTSIKTQSDNLIELRRKLHQIPETAFEEEETSAFVQAYLKQLKPDRLDVFCGTGVRAVFAAPGSTKTLAIRADMDALPIEEETQCSFSSRHTGKMHACGHDGHMAMALMTASLCAEQRTRLKTNCVFIFQPGEESEGGAKPLIDHGILEDPNVDEIYGIHLWPKVPLGRLGLRSGALMAGTSDFDLILEGTGGHGARPQDGTDAIVAGAYLISALQTIVSRSIDPAEQAVLTIGKIEGGTANNVLCQRLVMEGTVRTFDRQVDRIVLDKMDLFLQGTRDTFGVQVYRKDHMAYPPVINADGLYRRITGLLEEDEWVEAEPVMMSEDFAFYQERIPGFFAFLGLGDSAPLHTSQFAFDERILCHGVEYYARVLDLE